MDVGSTKGNRRYFLPVMRLDAFIMARDATSFARAVAPVKAAPTGADAPATLGAYLQGLDRVIDRHIADGAVGFKCGLAYRRSIRFEAVDRVTASRLYEHALAGSLPDAAAESLQDFLFHEVCDRAGALGVPYQIHTGLQNGNWGADIVLTNPVHLTNTLKAHPTTRFDLFHGGTRMSASLRRSQRTFRTRTSMPVGWRSSARPYSEERCMNGLTQSLTQKSKPLAVITTCPSWPAPTGTWRGRS